MIMILTMEIGGTVIEKRLRDEVKICEHYMVLCLERVQQIHSFLSLLIEKYRKGQKKQRCALMDFEETYDQ